MATLKLHPPCFKLLCADRAAPGEPRFPGLKAIARAEAEVETGAKTTLAQRHCLCSAPLNAETFARAVRAHWDVENRLHWVLDVVFHDDLARLRTVSQQTSRPMR